MPAEQGGLMKRDERTIFFYDLMIGSRSAHAQLPTMRAMLEILSAERAAGRFRTGGDRAGNLFHFLGPIEFDDANDAAVVLVRSTDRRSPEYGYSNVNNGALRLFDKEDDEGGDVAAHIVISLTPSEPNTYITLVEGVIGLNHRNIISLFNNMMRQFNDRLPDRFQFPDPAGARDRAGNLKLHSFKPRFKMMGHISDRLHHDLQNGTISNIELVNTHVRTTIGNDPFIHSDNFRLTLSVDPNIPRQNVLNRMIRAIQTKHQTYDKAKIRFVDMTGQPKSVSVDVRSGMIEQAYVQSQRISAIFPPLRMTTEAVVPRIAAPMIQMLVDYR
jgi:hypothetical protein